MIVKFKTPNGEMTLVAEKFFPVSKKDLKKLRKSVIDPEDVQKIHDAIGKMIAEIELYINDCKAKAEIFTMSAAEELEGSFLRKAKKRKAYFFTDEITRANEEILKLKGNQEAFK